jgi:hypothetical protein
MLFRVIKMHNRLTALTFVMMAIAAIFIFDTLNFGLEGDSLTGYVVAEEHKILSQNVDCFDSDNRNYAIQGTTYAEVFKVNGEGPKLDECERGNLIEYYCYNNDVQVEFYECANGCFDGKCV